MPPQRIVSLVPSLTELVDWLGASERLVGRTKFCTEPAGRIEHVATIGGTKNPNVERIAALAPDLVLANREENRKEEVELAAAGLRVLLTDPNTVEQAVAMIEEMGAVLGAPEKASQLIVDIHAALGRAPSPAVPHILEQGSPLRRGEAEIGGARVYVGVWHNPMMGLGSESYGHSLIEACGAVNVLRDRPRYPAISLDELEALKPDLILLPDEPFPFDEGHVRTYSAVAPARVVDGKLLWWYGPRMPAAIRALRGLFAEARS